MMKKNNLPAADVKDMMVGTYFFREGKIVQITAKSIFDCWRDSKEFHPIGIDISMCEALGGEFYFSGRNSYQYVKDVCIKSVDKKGWQVGFKTPIGTVSWTNAYLSYLHQFQILCLEINDEMPTFKHILNATLLQ